MKRIVLLIVVAVGLAGCAVPIVTDHSTINYQGRSYVVQYVTFEGGITSNASRNVNAAGVQTAPDYFQVVVDGRPYRCSAGPDTCADAVRRALAQQSRDARDGGNDSGGGYGGGY